MTIKYDLLLKNGEVIDPGDKRRGRYDIGFTNGVVATVGDNIPAEEA
jgi:predicted amidohydrolase